MCYFNGATVHTTIRLGGMHGDEFEGPVAIHNIVRTVETVNLFSRLILVPALNLPAVMAGTRLALDDHLNLNRVFLGDNKGSLTQRIGRMVTNAVIRSADNVIGLHSGR